MIVNSVNQVLYLYFFLYFKHYFTFLLSTKKKKTHIAIRIPWTLYTHHLVSGSIPGQGIKIPQAMWYDQKKKKIGT